MSFLKNYIGWNSVNLFYCKIRLVLRALLTKRKGSLGGKLVILDGWLPAQEFREGRGGLMEWQVVGELGYPLKTLNFTIALEHLAKKKKSRNRFSATNDLLFPKANWEVISAAQPAHKLHFLLYQLPNLRNPRNSGWADRELYRTSSSSSEPVWEGPFYTDVLNFATDCPWLYREGQETQGLLGKESHQVLSHA